MNFLSDFHETYVILLSNITTTMSMLSLDNVGIKSKIFFILFWPSNVQKAGTMLCSTVRNVATHSVTIRLGRAWMVEMWIQEKY